MLRARHHVLLIGLSLAVAAPARAVDQADVARRAAGLLEEIAVTPDSGIPREFLREARGIMIVPHLVENQLVVGRAVGHGIYLGRNDQGDWINPEAVELTGLSAGAEAGHLVTDLVVIFRTRKAADAHTDPANTLRFGFWAQASLHPLRKFSGPQLIPPPRAEQLIYSRSRGLVAAIHVSARHRVWSASPPSPPALLTPTAAPAADATRAGDSVAGGTTTDPAEVGRLKRALLALTSSRPLTSNNDPRESLIPSPASSSVAPDRPVGSDVLPSP